MDTLEEEITCNVCLEVYDDPHILKECLHTYCMKCIKKLQRGTEIRCPGCRKSTKLEDVKQDFKTQRLIDIYKAQKLESDHAGCSIMDQHQCGMCQTKTSQCTHHCRNCQICLCPLCAEGHRNIKALRGHKVTLISNLKEEISANLKITLTELAKQVENVESKIDSVCLNLTGVEQANTQQIAQLRKITEEGIEEMKRNQEEVEKLVSDVNQTVISNLRQSKTVLEQQRKELRSKMTLLRDLSQSQDIKTLQEAALSMNKTVKQDITKLKDTLVSQKNLDLKSPVIIQKSKNSDGLAIVKVTISDSPQIGLGLETLCSELQTKTFTLTHTVDLGFFNPQTLSMINNQLWCTGDDHSVRVFDTTCELIKIVEEDEAITGRENNAAATSLGIIVICRGKKGLHLLGYNGEHHSKIADGCFAAVSLFETEIYALEYQRGKVLVFKTVDSNNNKWIESNRYSLEHTNVTDYDRLRVDRNCIYVSSFRNHCIYVMDKHGNPLCKRGEKGLSRPGHLNHPILCSVDRAGSMLVADQWNHRLQVCDKTGKWTVIKLPGEIRYPSGVMLSYEGEMFITGESPSKSHVLQRYTMLTADSQ